MNNERMNLEQAVALVLMDDDDFVAEIGLDEASDIDDGPDVENQAVLEESDDDDYRTSPEPEPSGDEADDEQALGQEDDRPPPGLYNTKVPGVQWSDRAPSRRGQARVADILRDRPGPTDIVPAVITPREAFDLCFPPVMIETITQYTNQKLNTYLLAQNPDRPNALVQRFRGTVILREEIEAFIGILILQGAYKATKRQASQLWDQTEIPHYRATMARDRYHLILRFIRFDDVGTRRERRRTDKFAPLRELQDIFNRRCRELYNPSDCVTVDEQLVKFRGRCSFRQFMPSKPGKYGIKVWVAADAHSHYCYNSQPYLGRQDDPAAQGLGYRVVTDLVEPLYDSGRNVTMDRFFTSVDLGRFLLTKNLTMVGTVMANRRELPLDLLPNSAKRLNREVGNTMHAFRDNMTLISWQAKKTKTVLVLSTFHTGIGPDVDNKPEAIAYYNETKVGVDAMDQKNRNFTSIRCTNRWPLTMFYNMVDTAAQNGHVLYTEREMQRPGPARRRTQFPRFNFLKELGESLIRPQIALRAQTPNGLNQPTLNAMRCLGIDVPDQRTVRHNAVAEPGVRRPCFLCASARKRRAQRACNGCNRNVCGEHSTTTVRCDECP